MERDRGKKGHKFKNILGVTPWNKRWAGLFASRVDGLTCDFAIDFLVNMSASADVLAQAKVEIGLGTIPEGKNVRLIRLFL